MCVRVTDQRVNTSLSHSHDIQVGTIKAEQLPVYPRLPGKQVVVLSPCSTLWAIGSFFKETSIQSLLWHNSPELIMKIRCENGRQRSPSDMKRSQSLAGKDMTEGALCVSCTAVARRVGMTSLLTEPQTLNARHSSTMQKLQWWPAAALSAAC